MGCHAFFQGIFPTQGSNLHLFTSTALPGGFFTSSDTWEAHGKYKDGKIVAHAEAELKSGGQADE